MNQKDLEDYLFLRAHFLTAMLIFRILSPKWLGPPCSLEDFLVAFHYIKSVYEKDGGRLFIRVLDWKRVGSSLT